MVRCYELVSAKDEKVDRCRWRWPRSCLDVSQLAPSQEDGSQTLLFSKIVPNGRKLGPRDAGEGYLWQEFGEIGVIP